MITTYVALIHKASTPNADYGVCFPDFPGCVFGGVNLETAIEKAQEGLLFHIEGMIEAGEIIPVPTHLEKILAEPQNKIATAALIRVIVPTGHLKRINICMDAGLIAEIDRVAKASGRNRSEFLADIAKEVLA